MKVTKSAQQRCWAEQESSWLDRNCGFLTVLNIMGCTQATYCGNLWRSSSSRRIPWLDNQAEARCSPGEGGVPPAPAAEPRIPNLPDSPCVCLEMQETGSNWEISRAASWALQIGKNYLILGSRSRHPLVILSIKRMELILIINDELFASVIMDGGNRKKHSTFMMQKRWLFLNISSGISFGSIKKYFH